MSNIGRKPISLGSTTVEIKENEVHYKGPKTSGVYKVPSELKVELKDKQLILTPVTENRTVKQMWGLHRALLFNAIAGAQNEFQKQLQIVGLGYKAISQGRKIQFALGFSHKIDLELPENVQFEVDKTGQLLTFKSSDKVLLGLICSKVRSLRPPEPYKGTGILYVGEKLLRKAGKAKGA